MFQTVVDRARKRERIFFYQDEILLLRKRNSTGVHIRALNGHKYDIIYDYDLLLSFDPVPESSLIHLPAYLLGWGIPFVQRFARIQLGFRFSSSVVSWDFKNVLSGLSWSPRCYNCWSLEAPTSDRNRRGPKSTRVMSLQSPSDCCLHGCSPERSCVPFLASCWSLHFLRSIKILIYASISLDFLSLFSLGAFILCFASFDSFVRGLPVQLLGWGHLDWCDMWILSKLNL